MPSKVNSSRYSLTAFYSTLLHLMFIVCLIAAAGFVTKPQLKPELPPVDLVTDSAPVDDTSRNTENDSLPPSTPGASAPSPGAVAPILPPPPAMVPVVQPVAVPSADSTEHTPEKVNPPARQQPKPLPQPLVKPTRPVVNASTNIIQRIRKPSPIARTQTPPTAILPPKEGNGGTNSVSNAEDFGTRTRRELGDGHGRSSSGSGGLGHHPGGDSTSSSPQGLPSQFGWYYGPIRDALYKAWMQPSQLQGDLYCVVLIRIQRDGSVANARFDSDGKSGSAVMDDSVLVAVRSVARFAPLPPGLGEESGFIDIPVGFKLKPAEGRGR